VKGAARFSTTQVKETNMGASGQAKRACGSGKGVRAARDEIALVFQQEQGGWRSTPWYARALRVSRPCRVKVVLELTIAQFGDITAARNISSALNDKEFGRELLARIVVSASEDFVATADAPTHRLFPAGMNIQSEIEFIPRLGLIAQGPVVTRLISEVAKTKWGDGDGNDALAQISE